jgi:hypothetical protein
MAKYPETEQTYQAMINLNALNNFVSFNLIFQEVKRIRLSRNLKETTKNLKGRVRRSLTNDEDTFRVNTSEQSNKLSIAKSYPEYMVKSKKEIFFNEKGLAIDVKEIEENQFSLVKKDKHNSKSYDLIFEY